VRNKQAIIKGSMRFPEIAMMKKERDNIVRKLQASRKK
jgi:hypothetical protein